MSQTLYISTPESKRTAFAFIGALQGKHKMVVTRDRSRHSDPQRGYYFAVIVEALRTYMKEQGEEWSQEKTHEAIKLHCLPVDLCDPRTGEVIGRLPGSITKLDVVEMSEFIERCIVWLADFFGIVVPTPTMAGMQ